MKLIPETALDHLLLHIKQRHKTQTAAAKAWSMGHTYLSAILKGDRPIPKALLDVIGWEWRLVPKERTAGATSMSTLQQFNRDLDLLKDASPLEQIRYFCSLVMEDRAGWIANRSSMPSTVAWRVGRDDPDLLDALLAIEPYLDSIVCFASTQGEYEPNRLAANVRAAIAKALSK